MAPKSKAEAPKAKDPLTDDFRNFVWAIWKHLGLPDPTDVQYDISNYLQHGPKRRIIMAFRGVGKSWLTAAFVCWLLYRNADTKVLVVSANAVKAAEFTTFVLKLIREVPFLQHLTPRHDQRQSSISFDVGPARPDQSPSVKSIGITGQITGGRADAIVADDIEIPHNSDTPGKREKLLELIKEFDAVLKPGGQVIYLGTPQTEQTIYHSLQDRGYVARVWPARYPRDLSRYRNKLAPLIFDRLQAGGKVGATTDPQRFSDLDLEERELSYGRSGFSLQFMLDTSLSDAEKHPLKLSDLIVMPLDPYRAPADLVWASGPQQVISDLPMVGLYGDRYHRPAWTTEEYVPYEGSIMFVDPSGRGRDETAYAVVKQLHGRLYVTAVGGYLGTGYAEETLKSILMVAKKHSVNRILVEPNFGGGSYTALLQGAAQKYYGVTVEDAKWSSVQKEARIIDTLEPVMNQHRLIICPSVIQADYDLSVDIYGDKAPMYRLFYQMTRVTRDRGSLAFDDRLDALAGAVAHWVDFLAVDSEKATLGRRERELDDMLKKFVEHAQGFAVGSKTNSLRSKIGRHRVR